MVKFNIKSIELTQIMNHFLGGKIFVSDSKKFRFLRRTRGEGEVEREGGVFTRIHVFFLQGPPDCCVF